MSTPGSFHTPKDDSPSTRAYTTGVSSPAEDEIPDPKYRPAVQPVDELRSHCQIHLEEELCNPPVPTDGRLPSNMEQTSLPYTSSTTS